jgi:hypothetical protein
MVSTKCRVKLFDIRKQYSSKDERRSRDSLDGEEKVFFFSVEILKGPMGDGKPTK